MRRRLSPLARRINRRLWPRRLLHGPAWVILGVNNVCNLHCRMCDVGTGEDSNFQQHMTGTRPLQMPAELAERIIDQVARHFPRARLGFAFTEPTAWPHLVAAVASASRRGLATSVTTNGLLLPKLAGPLVEAGLSELVVSIDGPRAVHDHIRRREGSFDRAIEGIRAIAGRIDVSVFCAITEWNIGHLAELVAAVGTDVRRVGFMHTVFVSEAAARAHNAAWPGYVATPSNTQELDLGRYDLDRLWVEMGAIGAAASWSPTIRSRAELERYYRSPEPWGRRCTDVFENLLVKSDGTVIPAHSRCFPVVAGTVYEQELDVLWNAPALARLRGDLARAGGLFPGCSRCCSAR